jgi:dolichol-phosphate mannosyltransferase
VFNRKKQQERALVMSDELVYFLLPAYNEEDNLSALVERIGSVAKNYIIVIVEDGSTDRTRHIARVLARKYPITILAHRSNRGLGAALKTGLIYIAENGAANALVITMDSDMTHDPDLVPSLVRGIRLGADVVVASRYVQGSQQVNLPFARHILSRVINSLFLLKGSRVRDNTCGFRCMKIGILRKAIAEFRSHFITSTDFTATPEILMKLQAANASVREVPFSLDYGLKCGPSKLRLIATVRKYLKILLGLSPQGLLP